MKNEIIRERTKKINTDKEKLFNNVVQSTGCVVQKTSYETLKLKL